VFESPRGHFNNCDVGCLAFRRRFWLDLSQTGLMPVQSLAPRAMISPGFSTRFPAGNARDRCMILFAGAERSKLRI
jgi:hypothetical protein